jgi:hypothetical protein
MLRFTRHEARSILTVLRQAGLVNFSRRIQPPITLVQAGSQLRVLCASKDLWILWEREVNSVLKVGDGYPLRLTIPAILLKDCAGPDHGLVELAPDQDQVRAHWHEAGLVHEREYPQFDPPEENLFGHPLQYFPCPPELLTAFRETMAVRDDCTSRYALGCLQVSGTRQRIVGTDSHQLLICQEAPLPWNEEWLVQGTNVFESAEFRRGCVARIGKTESHLVLQVGHWKVGLKIQTESRFPRVDGVVPTLRDDATRWELHPTDAAQLKELLDRTLPAQSSKSSTTHHPLTVDLTGDVPIVRCRTNHSERATEIRLTRSSRRGKSGNVCLETRFLVSALEMGFHSLGFHESDSPVRLDQHQRVYILMPLDPDSLIPPGDHYVIATGPEQEEVDHKSVQEWGLPAVTSEMATI